MISSSFLKISQRERDHDLEILESKEKKLKLKKKICSLSLPCTKRNLEQEGRRYFDYFRLICVEDLRKLHVES